MRGERFRLKPRPWFFLLSHPQTFLQKFSRVKIIRFSMSAVGAPQESNVTIR
jgi:hypothetical protein